MTPRRDGDHHDDHLARLDDLARLPAGLVVGASAAMLVAVLAVDLWTGPDLQLLIFYLPPVVAVTWRLGFRAGSLTAGVVVVGSATVAYVSPNGQSDAVVAWNGLARFVFLFFVVGLVARQRSTLDQQRTLATTDPMTGALNRRAFYDICGREFHRADRHHLATTLLYLDVDGLKETNDRQGHEAGDQLLRDLATVLRSTVRDEDRLARLGGDEFALLIPATDLASGEALARRIHVSLAGHTPPLQASIGVATATTPPDDPEALVNTADRLMYEAKRSGGGTRAATFDGSRRGTDDLANPPTI